MTAATHIEPRPVDRVLSLLEGARQAGPGQWEARCPAHPDRSPSLAVSEGEEGRALVHCHAGCSTAEVLAAIGLDDRDLFAPQSRPERPSRRREVARYAYVDEAGAPLYDVVRSEPKAFHQEPANGRRGAGAMKGVRRVLFRLPDVLAAVAGGYPVFVVEGEKDALALASEGHVATCNPAGAGKWSTVPDAAEVLTGAHVFVWVDDDEPGHNHGRDVIRSIDGKAASWQVVRSRYAKDAAEHLGQGRAVDDTDLEVLATDADRSWLDGKAEPEPDPEPPPDDTDAGEVVYVDRRGLPGGDAILDMPDEVPAVWGEGSEVLWAEGEPAMIVAPPGVGKTTVAQQVNLALVGLRDEVLGYPVHGAPRRVLYLAMDRPRQIRRSFRRMVTEADRATLNRYLTIREGPPPADLASDPTLLVQLARWHDAEVVIIDSLKDAAVKLTDDETGGKVNRAIQYATAEGIDVLVLHHQRKGQNGEKPKKLEDVYGSTWLTAGMGSVLLLWGAAGDPIVELVHLKQPAEVVGPLQVEHDQVRGTTTVYRGFDVLRFLSMHPEGVTSRQVAVAMTEKSTPNDNDVRKARRKLEAAIERGIAKREGGEKGGEGGTAAAIYRPIGVPS